MKYLMYGTLLAIQLFSLSAFAGNRGEEAMRCITESQGEEQPNGVEMLVTNTCDEQVFILWCGDLEFDRKGCGDGPSSDTSSGFYTHSTNLEPGQSNGIRLKNGGSYNYAACFGGIGFGNDGHYTDNSDGSFTCLPTGEYKQSDNP